MKNWNGKHVLILGGARQGQAAARYLARHGAQVTINDQRSSEAMHAAQEALAGLSIQWVLGSHPLELLDGTDILCLSGGIPLAIPIVKEAVRRGIPLTNDTQIFMGAAPCRTIGITGSAGKTTTTALVGKSAEIAYGASAWIGGNIGDPLLNYVDNMQTNDFAILEISSFQLEQMTISPKIAAILNITPNHLDRHGTMEAYIAAKTRILEFQTREDIAILGRDDPGAWSLRGKVQGRLFSFGFSPLSEGGQGTFFKDDTYFFLDHDGEITMLTQSSVGLRGNHNKLNILATCAIAGAAGFPVEAIRKGIETFSGLAHRLEFVRKWRGVDWYNDSIATAPERTIAAIRSFEAPIVLLLGGRDKNLPWDDLVKLVSERVDHVVLFGEAANKVSILLGMPRPDRRPYSIDQCKSLEEAVHTAVDVAEPGDVVLLSPGGTSFDEFRDFEERGECFRKWVCDLS